VDDPVSSGIVPSLAHPGGHATGVDNVASSGLVRKRLELLTELVPRLSRLAYLVNSNSLQAPETTSVLQDGVCSPG
jgi:putative ABC transport system substrate-binding protein